MTRPWAKRPVAIATGTIASSAAEIVSAASTISISLGRACPSWWFAARSCPQPHASPAAWAHGALADQLNAGGAKRIDELHQRIDIAADDAVARFHALDGRQRQARALGQRLLVDAQQGPGRPHLSASNHASLVMPK